MFISSRSVKSLILLVACLEMANFNSSFGMPRPLSVTRILSAPPWLMKMSISDAPESMLFSNNSFKTDAGRSTTSPAAIWLIKVSGSSLMVVMLEVAEVQIAYSCSP